MEKIANINMYFIRTGTQLTKYLNQDKLLKNITTTTQI